MDDDSQFGADISGRGKEPWFGPKRAGFGYGPRTWQGYLVTGVTAALVVIAGAVAGPHSPWFVAAIVITAAVHFAVIAVQRR